jgi:hypothetical protein
MYTEKKKKKKNPAYISFKKKQKRENESIPSKVI